MTRRQKVYLLIAGLATVTVWAVSTNLYNQRRNARIEQNAIDVVDAVDTVIDMGAPIRESHRNKKCVEYFSESDLYCVDPGYPAWATAIYPIDGQSPVEVINTFTPRLLDAGYQLRWGPYCDEPWGGFGVVFETPDGYGVILSNSEPISPPSYDPDAPWGLKVRVTVDFDSGEPLPPDGYDIKPPNVLVRCGSGS